MEQFFIYLKVPAYLKQWMLNSFGVPSQDNSNFTVCKFPDGSVENLAIRTFTIPTPKNYIPKTPDKNAPDIVAVVIPQSKYKKPSTYNHITPKGEESIIQCIKGNFKRNMYCELGDLKNINCNETTAVQAWCEMHGIDIEHSDTVRQCYYRIREKYKKNGIDLMKHTKNYD